MKKKLKKITTILMCAWNLYMPSPMQDEQELQVLANSSTPVIEEIYEEEINEDVEENSKNGRMKRITSFLPSIIWTIFGLLGGILKYPLLIILGILLLLFIGWLLLKNKPWASLLGMGSGIGLIYIDIQDANKIIEEGYLGIFFIIYFLIILIMSLKSNDYKKIS